MIRYRLKQAQTQDPSTYISISIHYVVKQTLVESGKSTYAFKILLRYLHTVKKHPSQTNRPAGG
jgi:hypothetical protein